MDLAANAASLGATVLRPETLDELRKALEAARSATACTVIYVRTDPLIDGPSSQAWWDVPVAEVSATAAGQDIRTEYDTARQDRRRHLTPPG